MKLLKSVEKQLKKLMGKNALMFIAGAVVFYMIYQYSSSKGLTLDGMTGKQEPEDEEKTQEPEQSSVKASEPAGQNSDYASASGMTTFRRLFPGREVGRQDTASSVPAYCVPLPACGWQWHRLGGRTAGL